MIDFLAGLVVGLMLMAAIFIAISRSKSVDDLLEEFDDELTTEYIYENGMFSKQLTYDCPRDDCDAVSGVLCNTNGLWVHLERFHYADEMEEPLYDFELSYNEAPDEPGVWEEVEIQNDCGYGCKIYEHKRTGRRALMHNSAYGCRQ